MSNIFARRRMAQDIDGAEPTLLETVKTALNLVEKPAALRLAEGTLSTLRVQRAEVAERRRKTIASYREPNGADIADVHAVEAELTALDQRIGKARAKLREARTDWSPDFGAAVLAHRSAAARRIAAGLQLIAEGQAVLATIDDWAQRNGIEPPGPGIPMFELRDIEFRIRRLVEGAP